MNTKCYNNDTNDLTMTHISQVDKALASYPGLHWTPGYETNKVHVRLIYRQINIYMRQLIDKQNKWDHYVQSGTYIWTRLYQKINIKIICNINMTDLLFVFSYNINSIFPLL